jgi:hypothetical protein
MALKEWFRDLALRALERSFAKSRYAAAVMAAAVAERYVVVYDGDSGELEILDKSGYLLCWGFEDRESFDCITDLPGDLTGATVKRHVIAKYDDVEVLAV